MKKESGDFYIEAGYPKDREEDVPFGESVRNDQKSNGSSVLSAERSAESDGRICAHVPGV